MAHHDVGIFQTHLEKSWHGKVSVLNGVGLQMEDWQHDATMVKRRIFHTLPSLPLLHEDYDDVLLSIGQVATVCQWQICCVRPQHAQSRPCNESQFESSSWDPLQRLKASAHPYKGRSQHESGIICAQAILDTHFGDIRRAVRGSVEKQ